MSSGFCFPGNKLLQSVICRMRLHAAPLPAALSLYVKTEFYQKYRLHFLRIPTLTFHNFRRRNRSNGPVRKKKQPGFQRVINISHRLFNIDFFFMFQCFSANIPENVNPANGSLHRSVSRYAVSITSFSVQYAGKTAR